jgi:broad specificity phosphatase PhoE
MKVGLIRHFSVAKEYPRKLLVTAAEVGQWLTEYDTAEVHLGNVDLGGVDWKRCYASDLPRALTTARTIFQGEINVREELREISAHVYHGSRLRLPFLWWAVLGRAGWFFNTQAHAGHNQAVKTRVAKALDEILRSPEDVLIVSHAALMRNLQLELRRRGFRGPNFGMAANGRLYVFERP